VLEIYTSDIALNPLAKMVRSCILIFDIKFKHGLNDPKWCNIKKQDSIYLVLVLLPLVNLFKLTK